MNPILKRERSLYLTALLLLLINRLLIRFPQLVIPASTLANEDSWYYILVPIFGLLAAIYCVIASWRFFRFAGVSSGTSAFNALISPFLFPLILIAQMVFVFRRVSKANKSAENHGANASSGNQC